MYEIAHGIEVYYENKKEVRNIVFLSDGSYMYYSTGEILFEIISDEAIYMLTEKVRNMIKIYPNSTEPLTKNSVMDGFQWLYKTIMDEKLPIATELFRSCFNEVIHTMLRKMESNDINDSIGDF